MLRNSVVRRIDLLHMDAIAGCDNRLQQIKNEITIRKRQKSLNVFENKGLWFQSRHSLREDRDQGVSFVVVAAPACRRKPLAGRSTGHNGRRREAGILRDARLDYVVAHIFAIGCHRRRPRVDCANHFEPSSRET
jgi:hypothetical protein